MFTQCVRPVRLEKSARALQLSPHPLCSPFCVDNDVFLWGGLRIGSRRAGCFDEVDSVSVANPVVQQSATIVQLSHSEDESLVLRRRAIFAEDLILQGGYGISRLDTHRARQTNDTEQLQDTCYESLYGKRPTVSLTV